MIRSNSCWVDEEVVVPHGETAALARDGPGHVEDDKPIDSGGKASAHLMPGSVVDGRRAEHFAIGQVVAGGTPVEIGAKPDTDRKLGRLDPVPEGRRMRTRTDRDAGPRARDDDAAQATPRANRLHARLA